MHPDAYAFVRSVRGYRPAGLVLEIGGRDVNGSIRNLFAGDPYLSIDVAPGPGVDRVADGARFVPDIKPACIVCCEVLEHTPDAETICRHAATLLVPGGLLILTAAGPTRAPHSGVDGGPLRAGEYYRAITGDNLADWLDGFATQSIVEHDKPGDVYAVAQVRS